MILSQSGNIAGGRSLVPGTKLSIPHAGAVSAQGRAGDAQHRRRADCSRMSRMPQDANASPGAPAPPVAGVLALGLTLGLGAMLVVIPALRLALPPTELAAALLPDHHQDAETLAFVLAFVVVLPLAGFAGHRLAARLLSAVGERALLSVAACLLAGLAVGRARDARCRGGRARRLIRLAVGRWQSLGGWPPPASPLVTRSRCATSAPAGSTHGLGAGRADSARGRRSPSSTSVRSPWGCSLSARPSRWRPSWPRIAPSSRGQPGPGGRRSTSP